MLSLGLGVLSWKAPETLARTLASHREGGLADIFSEQMVLLQQSDAASRAAAEEHGYTAVNLDENLGILGGFDALASAMSSDIVVITENDFALNEPADVATQQIARCAELLSSGQADIALLRSRANPGEPFHLGDKFLHYYPGSNAAISRRIAGLARRTLRPSKAKRLLGRSTLWRDDAPTIASFAYDDLGEGFHRTTSQFLTWTNNPFMVRRDFFTDTILDYAKRAKTSRRVNGFKNLEIELNCAWWREQAFKIVQAPGLFTHGRIGHRGY